MSENVQTDAGAQAAEGEGNQQQQQARTYTQEEYNAIAGQVKELRGEAAKYRTTAKDLESRLSGYQDGLTKADADKLRGDLSGLNESLTKAQERALSADIRATAKDAGFADPTDALALVPKDRIKFDKDGEATNLRELLDETLKNKPHLRGAAPNVDAGARGGSSGKTDMNSLLRGALRPG